MSGVTGLANTDMQELLSLHCLLLGMTFEPAARGSLSHVHEGLKHALSCSVEGCQDWWILCLSSIMHAERTEEPAEHSSELYQAETQPMEEQKQPSDRQVSFDFLWLVSSAGRYLYLC